MAFKEDYLKNCTRFAKRFDKMCKIAKPVLGNVTQCGIVEYDDNGNMSIAANKPDFAECYLENNIHKVTPHWVYRPDQKEELSPSCADDFMQFIWGEHGMLSNTGFDNIHSFFYREKIKNREAYRHYFFCSDEWIIYNELINNPALIMKFINFFKQENKDILDSFKDSKLDISSERTASFEESIRQQSADFVGQSTKDKLIRLLQSFGKLDVGVNISDREWQCFQLYSQGKSANQTAAILNISRRTVETHFENLKNKLRVNSKSDLIKYLN